MEPERAFGEVLRELRRRSTLSQEELALEAGIERNYVSLLERGKNSASVRMIFKLCGVLGVRPSDFLREVEERLNKPASSRKAAPDPTPTRHRRKGL